MRTGVKNREPWEDHLAYCEGLGRILGRYASERIPVCILGDYNQRIPRVSQPPHVAEALIGAIPESFQIATAGMKDCEGANLIDHFTVSTGLEISITGFLPRTSEEGVHLSDHSGVVAILQVTD